MASKALHTLAHASHELLPNRYPHDSLAMASLPHASKLLAPGVCVGLLPEPPLLQLFGGRGTPSLEVSAQMSSLQRSFPYRRAPPNYDPFILFIPFLRLTTVCSYLVDLFTWVFFLPAPFLDCNFHEGRSPSTALSTGPGLPQLGPQQLVTE